MPIVAASDTQLRPTVLAYLNAKRAQNPSFSVLDVGGAANPWCDEYVTTYIDLGNVPTRREVIIGNILDPALWKSIEGRRWHFVICSHVLEDVRDPLFVVQQIQQVAQAGFVAMPNKHTEISAVESLKFPGYCHHRWIFTLQGQVLRAMAKLPLLGCYAEANNWLHLLSGGPFIAPAGALMAPPAVTAAGTFAWYDRSKARGDLELGFIWEGSLQFEFVNGDYCGPNLEAVVRMYHEELRGGL